MNIQEILNMVDEDIARAEEQQPDNKEENIDFLLSELEASRELDEDRLSGHAHYVSIPYPTG